MTRQLKRPVLRYHGGKWLLAPWIISFLPAHRIYVEPFGGGASVLMRKPRSYAEVYNDLEKDVVNVFRVLRDPKTAAKLRQLIELTPFARDEFIEAYGKLKNDIDRALKMIVRSFMGFGSASMTKHHKTGFRSNANRSGTTPAHDWLNWPKQIPDFVERLQGVVIENRQASEIILQHDTPQTLFYVDPPYVWETRSAYANGERHLYKHEMDDNAHRALAGTLNEVQGMVVLSGYPCELYDGELYADWHRHERKHLADGARERTEVLWLNDAAHDALHFRNGELFGREVTQ